MADIDIERRWKFNGWSLTDGREHFPFAASDTLGFHVAKAQDLYLSEPHRVITRLKSRIKELEFALLQAEGVAEHFRAAARNKGPAA